MEGAKKVIHWLYTNENSPVLYGNERELIREAKKKGITSKDVKDYLKYDSPTYSMHKQTVRKFKRDKLYADGLNSRIQLDILDWKKYKDYNSGRRYILVAYDVYSKLIYA